MRNFFKKRKVLRSSRTTATLRDDHVNEELDDNDSTEDYDNDEDDDYVVGEEFLDVHRKKMKKKYSRGKTISVLHDRIIEKALKTMGFYKYLRRNVCSTKLNSRSNATQILKKCACFIAYVANKLSSKCHQITIIRILKTLVKPVGHNLLYNYLEYLASNDYKPRTLVNTIGYVKSCVEWGIYELPQLQVNSVLITTSLFNEYADGLRRRVFIACIYLNSINLIFVVVQTAYLPGTNAGWK
jgi:hypothetical protein